MRPVRPPEYAVRVRADQRLGERRKTCIVGSRAGRDRDLDVGFSRPDQLHEVGEAGLLRTEVLLGATEMVEHDRNRRGGYEVLGRGEHRQGWIYLEVATADLSAGAPPPEAPA